MTTLHATSVQDMLCYDGLIRQVASSFEKNHSYNLPWEKIQRYFGISWSQFYYDVVMEINSRVFAIKQGVLSMVMFRYENKPHGCRCLIPLRQDITLW